MKRIFNNTSNESGSVTIIALLVLLTLTILGITSTSTTIMETNIARNFRDNKLSFFAAESGIAYVAENSYLYNSGNLTPGNPVSYPDTDGLDNDGDGSTDEADELFDMGNDLFFRGWVEYMFPAAPPPGYEIGTYRTHNYRSMSTGFKENQIGTDAERVIEEGFYRVGF